MDGYRIHSPDQQSLWGAEDVVLSIDPSLALLGWSVIKGGEILDVGAIPTKGVDGFMTESDSLRVGYILTILRGTADKHKVTHIVAEDPAGSKSSRANIALGLVKGAIIGLAVSQGLPLTLIPFRNVKKKLIGENLKDKDLVLLQILKDHPEVTAILEGRNKATKHAIADSLAVYISLTLHTQVGEYKKLGIYTISPETHYNKVGG